jgi:hypothetical protein
MKQTQAIFNLREASTTKLAQLKRIYLFIYKIYAVRHYNIRLKNTKNNKKLDT